MFCAMMMRGFSNKKCMKRIHSKRADVSKNEENSTLLSDSYERKDKSSKEKKKAALLIVVIIIIIINALNLKKRSSLTLREEER